MILTQPWAKKFIIFHFHSSTHLNNKITCITVKCIINKANDTQEKKIRISSFYIQINQSETKMKHKKNLQLAKPY